MKYRKVIPMRTRTIPNEDVRIIEYLKELEKDYRNKYLGTKRHNEVLCHSNEELARHLARCLGRERRLIIIIGLLTGYAIIWTLIGIRVL